MIILFNISYDLLGDMVEELPTHYEMDGLDIQVEREFKEDGIDIITLLLELYESHQEQIQKRR